MAITLFIETGLPLTNPVLKFLLILIIILFTPILMNRIKAPPLLGLIIAGAVIGPHGFNLIIRDSGIILSGTAGLLYIMFLAGLEIDLMEFKKNSGKSLVFGLLTFGIPMFLGIISGLYVLGYSMKTSILLASMFASHTLIAYPLISKMGLSGNRAVTITVGGTVITDTLALLVLAVIVGMTTGKADLYFWIRLSVYILLFGFTVLYVFPILGRWFLKRYHDSVSQYIFILVMVFSGAFLAELAGIEPIIGAFLSGLALNRLIPHNSPLMNRIDFVGNAIFIPFFLISVGMLIDYQLFYTQYRTLFVGTIMIIIATMSKYIAAWVTQRCYGFTTDERRLIFGLSNAQAAATLAAVMVGYSIIIGETPDGTPIRLLNENVLNGTILMILVTCTIATFSAQKGAQNIVYQKTDVIQEEKIKQVERFLIPIRKVISAEELVTLGILLRSAMHKESIFALSIVNENRDRGLGEKEAQKILQKAVETGNASDIPVQPVLRFDLNVISGITNVIRENKISDLILGLHEKKGFSQSFLGNLTQHLLPVINVTTFIYKPVQPIATIRRHLIILPEKAVYESGFPYWLIKIWNLARNSGCKLVFHGTRETLVLIKKINSNHPLNCDFREFSDYDHILKVTQELRPNDNLILIMSRKNGISYHPLMNSIPTNLNTYHPDKSFILIYPIQAGIFSSSTDLTNPAIYESIEKLEEISKSILNLFRNKHH
ncbi:cation:proton antiporter [Robertkochia solimangrovi]|uniref:cation:proton antiporter n=1 Tax=Robertkochia solimangrovi TaxID=2213046 RepID=UPI00117DBA83|nr:cation:proton antiporter [Robertkochia solimangrovi]TRZ42159.1 cation:proton antiporter [Robertkochia solimangrovi]